MACRSCEVISTERIARIRGDELKSRCRTGVLGIGDVCVRNVDCHGGDLIPRRLRVTFIKACNLDSGATGVAA